MKTTQTLVTPRCVLREIVAEDIEAVFRGLSHPEVIRYYGISFDSLEATQEQMIWFKHLAETETGLWWAICSLDNSVFYGAGGFSSLSKEHKKAEIGFWLLPEFWGKGFMQETFPVICDYGFNQLGLNRIEGFVEPENTACKKAIEKMNFTLEGTMRECEVKNGQFISIDIYSKLKDD